jgi:uncharacterized repeat protein (TIGR03803 family)
LMKDVRQQKTIRIGPILALTLAFAGIAIPAQAQTFTSLYTFPGPNGNPPGSAFPNGLVQGANGYLYGTTGYNTGGVFKISTSGSVTTLHSFDAGGSDTDGEANSAALVQATNGNFYGTSQGNSGGCSGPNGTCGVVYEITPSGGFTILYNFCSVTNQTNSCLDGTTTEVALVQASNGNLYGTNQVYAAYNAGTIFKLTLGGALTTLHSFCANGSYEDCPDGNGPYSPLVQGTDGNLYGTTSFGGANYFDGTAFKITPGGTFTTLHSFSANGDLGYYPTGGLVQAANGNFYGVTAEGGTTGGGTFFTMTASGAVTTLYSFCTVGNCLDGTRPNLVILATDGNFYGTTAGGGVNSLGTIFRVTPSGTLTTVHNFNGADGVSGTLMQDTSGTFYGTSPSGGAGYPNCNDCAGTAWSLSVGLAPFVETLPASGRVGASVKILGTNLRGATSVTFNGTSATFTVVSGTEITATVPTGATTGPVKVSTSRGTLTSNVAFQVP